MNAAAAKVASRLRDRWLVERRKLDAVLAECALAKRTPPDGYWQAESKARNLLVIADVLTEELPNDDTPA